MNLAKIHAPSIKRNQSQWTPTLGSFVFRVPFASISSTISTMKEASISPNKNRTALFLVSQKSGRGKGKANIESMVDSLKATFKSVDVLKLTSMEEGCLAAVKACGVYDALIVFGGDGTIRNIINAIAPMENTPILGYINGGTLCDFGINFGIHGRKRRALKIIDEGHICAFDVGKINDEHFGYCASVGAFADIPYIAKQKYKRRLGSLAYYILAAKKAFIKDQVKGTLYVNGQTIPFKTPFLLLLSGKHIAGFPVSNRSRTDDGKMELYVTKPGLFNGLVHYFFFKARTKCYISDHFKIEIDYPNPWDLDGEAGPIGNVEITCLKRKLRIFCSKKYCNC